MVSVPQQKDKGQIRKRHLSLCCIQETHLTTKDRHHLRVKRWKKLFYTNCPRKQIGMSIIMWMQEKGI